MNSKYGLQAVALRMAAFLVTLAGLALGVVASSAPVLARGMYSGDTTGYSISVVASSADYYYPNNTQLTATLSYPASNPPTIVTGKSLFFSVDGQVYDSNPNVTETSPAVIFSAATATGGLVPGQHTVTATYIDLTTNTQVTSSPITLTVEKLNGNSSLYCDGGNFVQIGQPMQFTVNLTYPFAANNWTNATVTIKFVGPTTVVSAPQVVDNYGHAQFSLSAPTQPGKYQIQCILSGNNDYTPGQFDSPLTVSYGSGVGGAQLYSNPTPLHLDTTNPFTLYLVLHAAQGHPAPTGLVYFRFLNGVYGPGKLNADGALLAAFTTTVPLGTSSSNISVEYMGDTNYGQVTLSFSQTNPPIPENTGSSGSSGSSNLGSGAPATPNPNATVTATVTTTVTATAQSATDASNSPMASVAAGAGPNWALIVGLIVAVLVVLALIGGGVGGFLAWRARRAPLASPTEPSGAQSPYGQYIQSGQPGQSGQSSPYAQRDSGWNNPDASPYPDQSQATAPTPRYRPSADDAQW